MTSYEIAGWHLPSIAEGVKSFFTLIDSAAAGGSHVCLEAHFRSFDGMEKLSRVLPGSFFACYCWSSIADPQELQRVEFRQLGEATFVFPRYEVSYTSRLIPPPYDWNGKPFQIGNVALIDKNTNCSAETRTQEQTIGLLQEILKEEAGAGSSAEVHVMNMTMDGNVCYRYLVSVPVSSTPSFLRRLFLRLSLTDGLGSFEFLGTSDQIRTICQSGLYRSEDFPKGCRNFNASSGKTSFSLGRASFLYPVLNATRAQSFAAADQLDQLGNDLSECFVVKKYVQWSLGGGNLSPRTQDNYLILSKQKQGCRMFLGVEQYSDDDPSVKQTLKSILPVLGALGIKLKAVSCFR